MAEDVRKVEAKTGGDDQLLVKLERLETSIQEIDKAGKQQAIIARVGLLLIFIAIVLFAWNLYSFSKTMLNSDNVENLFSTVAKDMQDLVRNDQELQSLRDDVVKNIIPDLSKQVLDRFTKEVPVLKEKGQKMLTNIQVYLEESIKMKLAEELDKATKEVENEILEKYPKISFDKLDKAFKSAENTFVEHITDVLEKKLEMINDDLDGMEKTLDKFEKIAEKEKTGDREMDMVKLDFMENLLELAIYHINPEKGEFMALSSGVVRNMAPAIPTRKKVKPPKTVPAKSESKVKGGVK